MMDQTTRDPLPPRIDRRRFLHGGLAAGAGAAIGVSVPARARAQHETYPERRRGHRISLSCAAYSFRGLLPGRNKDPKMTLEDFIDFCAAEELDGVELTSYFFPRTDAEYLASLKRRAFLNGLTITGTPVGNNFCHPAGPTRSKELEHVKSWIDNATLLGAPCIRVFGGSAPSGVDAEQATAWCVETMKEACEYAAKSGIVLALENHGGITSTADQIIGILKAVDSPWLGINLDTGNFHEKDPYEEIEKAAPHAVVAQLKVEVRLNGEKAKPADLGRKLKILQKSGFRGVVALEYEADADPAVAVPRYLSELKRLLQA